MDHKRLDIEDFTDSRSFYRGYYYLKDGYVKSSEWVKDAVYKLYVQGSQEEPYEVLLNLDDIEKSRCTCPYCRRNQHIFCKHKVAAFLSLHPDQTLLIDKRIDDLQAEEDDRNRRYDEACEKIEREATKEAERRIKEIGEKTIIEEYKKSLIRTLSRDKENEIYDEIFEIYRDPDYEDDDDYYNEDEYDNDVWKRGF